MNVYLWLKCLLVESQVGVCQRSVPNQPECCGVMRFGLKNHQKLPTPRPRLGFMTCFACHPLCQILRTGFFLIPTELGNNKTCNYCSHVFSLSRISSTLALWRQNPLCPSQRTGCDSEGPSCLCVQMFLFLWSEYRTTGPVFVTLLYSDMINYCVVISQELRAFGNVGGAGHVQLDLCSPLDPWCSSFYADFWIVLQRVSNIISLCMYINDADYLADSIEQCTISLSTFYMYQQCMHCQYR